ncbi:hypothetical protein L3X38_027735 [Prunus dulcis]|uniref:Uncharacterized protein n=1 Tax=Prunus dulcis TaxID=3755 RepID=A0AAD4VNM1_PRUDU|nr:hypothetical protein L3X38_027735 [Prunus dulcis]
MRKSGLTRGSPNLVILCLRKGLIFGRSSSCKRTRSGSPYIGLGRRALCSYFRYGTVGAGREHDTCPRAKASRCIAFGRGHAEGHVVTSVDSIHMSGGHWPLIIRLISSCKAIMNGGVCRVQQIFRESNSVANTLTTVGVAKPLGIHFWDDAPDVEIMALLLHPKENTPPRRDPVELPMPMIESFLHSIVSNYEDPEYFNCMMSE